MEIKKTLKKGMGTDTWVDASDRSCLCDGPALTSRIHIPKRAKKLYLTASLTKPCKMSNVVVIRSVYYGAIYIDRSRIGTYTQFNHWLLSLKDPNAAAILNEKVYLSFEWS